MDPQDDPEAQIKDLERPLSDMARASETGAAQPGTSPAPPAAPAYGGPPAPPAPPAYGGPPAPPPYGGPPPRRPTVVRLPRRPTAARQLSRR